jgi:hypothetical protein
MVELGAAALVDEQGAAELMLVLGAPQHVMDLEAAKLICTFLWDLVLVHPMKEHGAAELLLGLEVLAPAWWCWDGEACGEIIGSESHVGGQSACSRGGWTSGRKRSFEPHGGAWCGGAHDGTGAAELVVDLGAADWRSSCWS